MKKSVLFLSVLFCTVLMAKATTNENKQTPPPGIMDLFLEFEQQVSWLAVVDNWKTVREQWGAATMACKSPSCMAQRLVEFESNVKWDAVTEAWGTRREAWLTDCSKVKTYSEFAYLMVEFEANVKWEFVSETWAARREAWVKDCASVK